MISYGRQSIDQTDIDSVVEVLKSDYLTQGEMVPKFEKSISDFTGAKYAVAVNSGTSALHIACMSLDVGKGDVVWVPAISFVATANCALYCGASVDFIDIDPHTGNLDINSLRKKISDTKKECLPKVVIVVHMAGNPCPMKSIYEILNPLGVKIIEDASHALGASSEFGRIGNCKYSAITTLSFHPVKIITTGEGGMALTNSEELMSNMRMSSSHGITKDKSIMSLKTPWSYEQQSLGYNYRMSDIQAALGLSQSKRISEFVEKRRVIAKTYENRIDSESIDFVVQDQHGESSYHLFMIKVKNNKRKELYDFLSIRGINSQVHYYPIYLQPYYKNMGFKEGCCENSELYYRDILSIPIYPSINNYEIDKVLRVINEF